MATVIILEDQRKLADRLEQSIQNYIPTATIRKVFYSHDYGGERRPKDVAREAGNNVVESSVFLVDLLQHPDELKPDYGLEVILELANSLEQPDIESFLMQRNFLVVVVTIRPEELTQDAICRLWKVRQNRVMIQNIRNKANIKTAITNRRNKPILPVVEKNTHEALIPDIIKAWVE